MSRYSVDNWAEEVEGSGCYTSDRLLLLALDMSPDLQLSSGHCVKQNAQPTLYHRISETHCTSTI